MKTHCTIARTPCLAAAAALALGLAAAGPAQAANPAACTGCHGANGEGKGANPQINDLSKSAFVDAMKAYKSGERKHPAMNAVSKPLSESDIVELAEHFTAAGGQQGQAQAAPSAAGQAQAPSGQAGAAARQQAQSLEQACAESWLTVDADKNGKISRAEADEASALQFRRIDVDDNGVISVKEWKACATPAVGNIEPESRQEALAPWNEATFSAADADQSGGLTAEEAAKTSAESYSGEEAAASGPAFWTGVRFASVDRDGNGEISEQEWQNRAKARFDGRFEALDEDGDGGISKQEFTEHRKDGFEAAAQAQQGDEPTVWYYYHFAL